MAYSKALPLLGLLSIMLLISSKVSARQLAESTTSITDPEQSNGFKWDDDLHKCKGKGHDQSGYEGGGYGHGGYEAPIAPNHKKDKDHDDCGKGRPESYGQFDNYGSYGKGGDN